MADPAATAELIELIDRLEELLVRSALSELEVQAGDTTLVLRSTAAMAVDPLGQRHSQAESEGTPETSASGAAVSDHERLMTPTTGLRTIVAPLTGLFYTSPAPGAAAYLKLDGQVNDGQVIGLIEAMKLFNEIKSDVTGTVRRIAVEDGALVKAKQTLIEVEPS